MAGGPAHVGAKLIGVAAGMLGAHLHPSMHVQYPGCSSSCELRSSWSNKSGGDCGTMPNWCGMQTGILLGGLNLSPTPFAVGGILAMELTTTAAC
jgi:hypothetical protein